MKLTPQQLNSFNVNGFLILRDFANIRECEAILDIAKVHIKYRVEPIETELGYHNHSKEHRTNVVDYSSDPHYKDNAIRRLRQVYSRDVIFKNWMENIEIRPILEQILGEQVVITTAHHNSIMTKMAKVSTATGWHQDRRYWNFSNDNLISVWLALDKEDSENGVLEFIPKSHKMSFKKEQFDEKDYFRDDIEKNISLIKTKVSTTLKRGDVVIFHSLLLHRANKNSSDREKISFVYTVKGALTKAIRGSRSSEYLEVYLNKLSI